MPKPRRTRRRPESVIPKDTLAKEVARILEEQGITQTEAAYAFRGSPSEVSLIVNGRTRGFSPEKIVRVLTALGRDVDIVLRKSKGAVGKVRVVAQ